MQFRKRYFILSLLFSGCFFAMDILFYALSDIEYDTSWGNKVSANILYMLISIGKSEGCMLIAHLAYTVIVTSLAALYFLSHRKLRSELPCAEFLLPIAAGVCGVIALALPILIIGIYLFYILWFGVSIYGLVHKEPPEDDGFTE